MQREPMEGLGYDLHETFVRTHQSELLAEAAAERSAHVAAGPDDCRPGLRRRLGLFLVRIGRAVAGETPGQARPGHAARPG